MTITDTQRLEALIRHRVLKPQDKVEVVSITGTGRSRRVQTREVGGRGVSTYWHDEKRFRNEVIRLAHADAKPAVEEL